MITHKTNIRVYYEDTDSGAVVYYANYLKFAERARTELLRENGVNQLSLSKNEGVWFVVKRANLELFAPARLDDMLTITTNIKDIAGARINMLQDITCGDTNIASLDVVVVCVNSVFKPTRIPAIVLESLQSK